MTFSMVYTQHLPTLLLVGLGLRELSMQPRALDAVRDRLDGIHVGEMEERVQRLALGEGISASPAVHEHRGH